MYIVDKRHQCSLMVLIKAIYNGFARYFFQGSFYILQFCILFNCTNEQFLLFDRVAKTTRLSSIADACRWNRFVNVGFENTFLLICSSWIDGAYFLYSLFCNNMIFLCPLLSMLSRLLLLTFIYCFIGISEVFQVT